MKAFFRKWLGGSESVNRRNQEALQCLKELGFHPSAIRRAVLELNQVRIKKFVNGKPPSMIYQTIRGIRKNRVVQEQVAAELGVKVEELFPEAQQKQQAK